MPGHNYYETAWKKALAELKERDPSGICLTTGAGKTEDSLTIRFFEQTYTVSLHDGGFSPPDIHESERILVLHYLLSQGPPKRPGQPKEQGRYVSYESLPGGMFYYPTYRKRSVNRLIPVFGGDPERLLAASENLGGKRSIYGDVSVGVPVFPHIEAVVVFHRGDDEFPPDAGILYRDDIAEFLTLEDIAVLGDGLTSRLIKRAKGI